MSAKHALLGLLLEQEGYAYELENRLRARLGPTWAINSVYGTIKRLEQEGLVERVGVAETRAHRQVYRASEEGAREFEQWFEQGGIAAELSRRPVLVKVTLAGPDRLGNALAQIDAYERDCAERLQALSGMLEEETRGQSLVRADDVLLRLNLRADVFQLEGELQWVRYAREVVSWLGTRDAVWPAARDRGSGPADRARETARRELFSRMAAQGRPTGIDLDEEPSAEDAAGEQEG